jgi:hypothetical protein
MDNASSACSLPNKLTCGLLGNRVTGGVEDDAGIVTICQLNIMLSLRRVWATSYGRLSRFPARRWSSNLQDERPLAGIKVVDLTRVLAGPLATMMLVCDLLSVPPRLIALTSSLILEVSRLLLNMIGKSRIGANDCYSGRHKGMI